MHSGCSWRYSSRVSGHLLRLLSCNCAALAKVCACVSVCVCKPHTWCSHSRPTAAQEFQSRWLDNNNTRHTHRHTHPLSRIYGQIATTITADKQPLKMSLTSFLHPSAFSICRHFLSVFASFRFASSFTLILLHCLWLFLVLLLFFVFHSKQRLPFNLLCLIFLHFRPKIFACLPVRAI